MVIYKLGCKLYIESDAENPEDIAIELACGLEHALAGFPLGEVLHAEVLGIRQATAEEISEAGLDEL